MASHRAVGGCCNTADAEETGVFAWNVTSEPLAAAMNWSSTHACCRQPFRERLSLILQRTLVVNPSENTCHQSSMALPVDCVWLHCPPVPEAAARPCHRQVGGAAPCRRERICAGRARPQPRWEHANPRSDCVAGFSQPLPPNTHAHISCPHGVRIQRLVHPIQCIQCIPEHRPEDPDTSRGQGGR